MNPLGSLIDIVAGTVVADLQTLVAGDYISLKNSDGVLVVFFKGIGTDGDDPTLEVTQATNVAGGGAKDLNAFVDVYKKQGALLSAVTAWTKVTQTADEDFVGDGTSAQEQAIYAAWISATQLDVANGFDCLRVDVKDVGTNAQLGGVLYILCGLRYPGSPTSLPSSITN